MRQLVDGFLDAADVLQLAARVAMHQLQAVEHVALAQHLEHFQYLGDEQPELGAVAGGLAPAPRALAGQLHAHADPGSHAVGGGMAQDQVQLGEVFHHRDDGASQLGGQGHRLDVAGILEPVADDQPVGRILGHGHHGQQFRLGSDLQAKAVFLAVAVHLFDHQALLVDLDGKHRGVAVAVFVLGDGLREHVVQALQPVREDVREAHHHRRAQVALGQSLHHFVQVDFPVGRGVGAHHDVTGRIDREIALAPRGNLEQLQGILNRPRGGRPRPRDSSCRQPFTQLPWPLVAKDW